MSWMFIFPTQDQGFVRIKRAVDRAPAWRREQKRWSWVKDVRSSGGSSTLAGDALQ